MSVGCFIGIRASYTDEAQDVAAAYLSAISAALGERRLPSYADPAVAPDVYNDGLFGRSTLDHDTASCLCGLAERVLARRSAPHLALLLTNPYRVAFLPIDFDDPLATDHAEQIFLQQMQIWIGSAPRLLAELVAAAPLLGIPMQGDHLPDEVAANLNEFKPLYDGDDCALAEGVRIAWLTLHEGARLAVKHGTALSLAG